VPGEEALLPQTNEALIPQTNGGERLETNRDHGHIEHPGLELPRDWGEEHEKRGARECETNEVPGCGKNEAQEPQMEEETTGCRNETVSMILRERSFCGIP
jgi:hypothetical protein